MMIAVKGCTFKLAAITLLATVCQCQETIPNLENIASSRDSISNWLVWGCRNGRCSDNYGPSPEYEGYDGWYNNPSRPDLGAIDTPLLRRVPAAYEDGVYKPSGSDRPNPLELSRKLLSGDPGLMSKTGKSALLVFFGQQVVEEILDAQRAACPPEYFNVPIPEDHEYRTKTNHTEMPVLRTRFDASTGLSPNNPRQQLNEITPYLDGGLMYGTTRAWADQLRTYENGTTDPKGLLATSHDGLFPEYNTVRLPMANPPPPTLHHEFIKKHELLPVSRFFKLGNPRGNENTFLLTFGIMWFRWHNHLARAIARKKPDWSGEKVFNEARKWTIATQQHIVVYKWLPEWLSDNLPEYDRYDPSIDPQIDQFFQSAAFRFGHTLVPSGVYFRDYGRKGCEVNFPNWNRTAVRTCNSFWRPQDAIKNRYSANEFQDIDRLLMGMAFQACEREDNIIVEDLRGRVFGPLEFSRRDLMALNIQRGRDHGLPDFNTARKAYNLPPVTNVNHFSNVGPNIRRELIRLYGNLDNLDIWVGGILETGESPGEFFTAVIKDQFRRIRDGDRFWFENKANGLFTDAEIRRIKQLDLSQIIMAVTKMDAHDIQHNVFQIPLHQDLPRLSVNCTGKLQNNSCIKNGLSYRCYNLPALNQSTLNESCTEPMTYDYFSNSEVSYILTFTGIGTFMIGVMTLIWILLLMRKRNQEKIAKEANIKRQRMVGTSSSSQYHQAEEWIKKDQYRNVQMAISEKDKQLRIMCLTGPLLRGIQFSITHETNSRLQVEMIKAGENHLIVKAPHQYDLVVKFASDQILEQFLQQFKAFITKCENMELEYKTQNLKDALKNVTTQEQRQKTLEKFFRVAFSLSLKIKHKNILENELIERKSVTPATQQELTLHEFAEALSMRPTADFVIKMFRLIDKDQNGFVSFQEFVNLLVLFKTGTADDKLRFLFDMYDLSERGVLDKAELVNMLKSTLDLAGDNTSENIDDAIDNMFKEAGFKNEVKFNFQDFKKLLGNFHNKLENANLEWKGDISGKRSGIKEAMEVVENIYSTDEVALRVGGAEASNDRSAVEAEKFTVQKEDEKTNAWRSFKSYIEANRLELFWKALYALVLFAIFSERAYYYTVEREHSGLRRIAGLGVTLTRGAASAMMFTYSTLLLTMCRNTITKLRETPLHLYIPFDRAVDMHKFIARWALVFTIIHIIGHAFNFYHISTQTSDDLTCLFRNFFHSTHEIPKFHYWCWQTITGVTGIALTLLMVIMYSFTFEFVKHSLYKWFWMTHSLYPIYYILMILHGAGRLIQAPFFHYFFLGPVILFALDMTLTYTRRKFEIAVDAPALLPSGVTLLKFRKPQDFAYKSGQWVRIACTELNSNEFHPFTLSSSPHEDYLSVHIRAVGPWTTNIRKVYDPATPRTGKLSTIRLDGPYGEAHQDWHKYDVAILVGGGIGVTPFASILKDIVYKANLQSHNSKRKVYFMWVTKTQKQFEWLVDIIRDLENSDVNKTVVVHIFITQFYRKFDLRTILLYICERHFQKTAGRSMFTGLKAVTHFGRPDFYQFFNHIRELHHTAKGIGVFTCGPPAMSDAVESATRQIVEKNLNEDQLFTHHYTNF